MTTIYDVKPGDYIQVTGTREYKRIQRIMPVITSQEPLHYRSWTVITEDGAELDMWNIARYFTRAEYDEVTGKPLPHADPRPFIR